MAKNIITRLFAGEPGDDDDEALAAADDDIDEQGAATQAARPRSLADAWEQVAEENRRLEARLASLEDAQRQMLEISRTAAQTAQEQLKAIHYLGRFHEAAEKRGRQMENAFQGVPDVLRTLPSATREQAEKLSEIAARLYEKAQDNTVNALKSAQANHQRVIEDLIEKSLGASRKMLLWAMLLLAASLGFVVFAWLEGRAG